MIPNGKEMTWKGHHLVFESEPDPCRGCFFADKDECPDCDEGAWVEDDKEQTMTNAEFLKKATVEDMASFFMERTKCEGCFISDYCVKMSSVSDLSCRGMFRAWLEDEAEEKQK